MTVNCDEALLTSLPLLMRISRAQGIALLAWFVLPNMNEAAREEFMRVLRDAIAQAKERSCLAALRDLEEQRSTNEQLAEQLSEIERVISVALQGDVEGLFKESGGDELTRLALELCAEGEPPPGSLL